jgi:hypothetical protein
MSVSRDGKAEALVTADRPETLELLLTAPVREISVVLAKYAATLTLVIGIFTLTLAYAVILGRYGEPDWGPIYAGYLALALGFVGTTSRKLRRAYGRIPVLMYHRVRPDGATVDGIEPGMFVKAKTFEKHVRWLSQRFDLVTLSQALDLYLRERHDLSFPVLEGGRVIGVIELWPPDPETRDSRGFWLGER